jgi:hypothetical protein
MNRVNKAVLGIIGLVLLLAVLALWSGEARPVTAQLAGSDMRQLLSDLWERTQSELSTATTSNFVFAITFKTSISGLGNSITFGQNLGTLELQEAGTDYFCVARKFSRNTNVDCVPYENVSTIAYTVR